ncbi:glycosyltransferase family 4 protein [Mycolicibacterium stellerae]|uniref:glycosyltransferase family 4 protein n=1 Tax=Mycolicibacterium stellerae TaxID=2358193 RepID=UPI001F40594D|nr:glycosyltransferase family 1 protein [Mycolicibacterium stellerae]
MVRALAQGRHLQMVVHVPAGAAVPDWMRTDGIEVRRAPLSGQLFEQIYLPIATMGKLLLNFAGPAPILKRRQLVTMHDATTFRYRRTFRPAFVAFYTVMYWILARTARQLITVSHFSAGELADVLGVSVDRFLVAPCAADSLLSGDPIRPDLEHDGDRYLVVGTLARHKNLIGPVVALAESGRTTVVVGVAGDSQVFAKTQSMDGVAVIAGRLSDDELAWLYRNSRALVFPSKYEGFGLPPLEAQVLGCPVISSNAASLPEVCGDGALYFDPDDNRSLIEALDRLENDDELADELRRRGAANARRFSWENSANVVADCIRQSQPGRRSRLLKRAA